MKFLSVGLIRGSSLPDKQLYKVKPSTNAAAIVSTRQPSINVFQAAGSGSRNASKTAAIPMQKIVVRSGLITDRLLRNIKGGEVGGEVLVKKGSDRDNRFLLFSNRSLRFGTSYPSGYRCCTKHLRQQNHRGSSNQHHHPKEELQHPEHRRLR